MKYNVHKVHTDKSFVTNGHTVLANNRHFCLTDLLKKKNYLFNIISMYINWTGRLNGEGQLVKVTH